MKYAHALSKSHCLGVTSQITVHSSTRKKEKENETVNQNTQ